MTLGQIISMSQGTRTLLQYRKFGLIPDGLNAKMRVIEEAESLFFNDPDDNKQETTPIAAETEEGRSVAVWAWKIPRWTQEIVHF